MRHPELLYIASDRCNVPLIQIIYGAFESSRIPVDQEMLLNIKDRLLRSGQIPQFIEDHALKMLAKNELENKERHKNEGIVRNMRKIHTI